MKNIIIASVAILLMSFSVPRVEISLTNESSKSIPLQIPGVMNPNLSPNSKSGVNLRVGQEIYFYPKGKRYFGKKKLLLTVTADLDGKTLVVNELIIKREKELDAEKEKKKRKKKD